LADGVLLVGPLDRVLYLRTLPAMDRLSAGHLAAIAAHAQEQFFPRGSTVITAGLTPNAFFIVVDGSVALERAGRREAVVGPGESIGLLPLLAGSAPGYEAIAVENTLTLRLDWEDHLDVCEWHFPIVEHYLEFVSQQMLVHVRERPNLLLTTAGQLYAMPAVTRRLNSAERFLVLTSTGTFPEESPDAVNELARHVGETEFSVGGVVWRQEEEADHFLVILQGELECRGIEGRQPVVLGPAHTVGMQEALGAEPRWAECVAVSPVRALRIEIAALYDILEDHFDMAIDFLALRAAELLRAEAER